MMLRPESRNEKGMAQVGGSLKNKTCYHTMRNQKITGLSNIHAAMNTGDNFIKFCKCKIHLYSTCC